MSNYFFTVENSLFWETFNLILKAFIIVNLFIFVRAAVPRYKYLQLIKMCWTVFIPFLLFYILVCLFSFAEFLSLEEKTDLMCHTILMEHYEPVTEVEVKFLKRYREV